MEEKHTSTMGDLMAELFMSASFVQNGFTLRQQAETCKEGCNQGLNECTQDHIWCAGCDRRILEGVK